MGDGKDRGDTMQNNIRNGLNKKVAFIGICCLLPVTILCARESGVQPAQVEFHDIVIVGGGISGLTAGYFLKDKDLVLLEKMTLLVGVPLQDTINSLPMPKVQNIWGSPMMCWQVW
ncbi:hypothetical protein FT670_21520 [Aeromonas jandaei]|nr:hypothetical protein FT670_21520 [Aeromonas jandaei]